MKHRGLIIIIMVLFLVPFSIWADDTTEVDPFAMSEDDMFSDADSVEDVEEYKDESVTQNFDKATFGITTELSGEATYGFASDKAKNDTTSGFGHDNTSSITFGEDLLIDARWKYGLKFFSDVYVSWTPSRETGTDSTADVDTATVTVREIFGDFNIAQRVYFRVGKQTLKWGKGYFWNPTDLISSDRKDFNNINARREGATGMKISVPFGTWLNLYSFIDITNADTVDKSAVAAKVEMLVGSDTEVSVSGWSKEGYKPVYGFDFSTHAFDTQWRGELSVSKGGNQKYIQKVGATWVPVTPDPDEIVSQLSLGFTKTFDIGDINDRLALTGEFLINPKGYVGADGLLQSLYVFQRANPQDSYLVPMYHGKAYAGFFVSWSRFLGDSDLTLSANTIANFSDKSAVLATNLSYLLGYDTTLTLGLKNYIGDDAAEFTYQGNFTDISFSFSTTL